MTTKQVIAKLKRKKAALRRNLIDQFGKVGEQGVQIAKQYSQGTLNRIVLAQLGHPYGRRSGLSPVNAEVINKQTGRFLASWFWRLTPSGNSSIALQIVNNAPYAKFLDKGTKRMIERPIRQVIVKKLTRPFRKAVQTAMRRALKA